ncbi:hypothetical protein CWO84_22325 [Methylomonas sp. Kb3]|uniref:hypothetical protein n=1 Tax=Methylomonas sp. Kb3 TaxID=1611544 RepID=UPI000C324C82|nr:hypothetical protein [Methylomonas sp. Kb3]PKD37988.1 hypothetical protein CWO84_22325 [Methylomonas sp. Kb3]
MPPFNLNDLAYTLAAIFFVIFASSFLLPAIFLKGRFRLIAIVLVFGGWFYSYYLQNIVPEAAGRWRTEGIGTCKSELQALPDVIVTDGFLDEGGAMQPDVLIQLFRDRKLLFVETSSAALIGFDGGMTKEQSNKRLMEATASPWVRLELATDGDPACPKSPSGKTVLIDEAPFLPETCISRRHIDSPAARVALLLSPPANEELRVYGKWKLIDKTSGADLASLTTIQSRPAVPLDSLSFHNDRRLSDCNKPATTLVDRLRFDSRLDSNAVEYAFDTETAKAKIAAETISSLNTTLSPVQVTAENGAWSEAESWFLFNREIRPEEWRATVDIARNQGVAAYGSRIVDWSKRKLINLDPLISSGKHWAWKVSAVGQGFFVVNTATEWNKLLIRYRHDGTLDWFVQVIQPKTGGQCARFQPEAIYTTKTHLVIADRCGPQPTIEEYRHTRKPVTGELWLIPLTALPKID